MITVFSEKSDHWIFGVTGPKSVFDISAGNISDCFLLLEVKEVDFVL